MTEISSEITAYLISAAILNVYFIACLVIFLRCRNRPAIQRRLPLFVIVCSVLTAILANTYLTSIFNTLYTEVIPAFVYLWIYYWVVPLFLYCSVLRDMYVIFLHYLNVSRLEDIRSNPHDKKRSEAPLSITRSDLNFFDRITLKLCFKLQQLLGKKGGSGDGKSDFTNFGSFSDRDLIKLSVYILLVESSMALLMNIVSPGNRLIPLDFPPWKSDTVWYPLYFFIVLYVILKVLLLVSYRKIKEPFGLKVESFIHFSVFLVLFIPYVARVKTFVVPDKPQSRNLFTFILTVLLNFSHTLFPIIWDVLASKKLQNLELNEKDFHTTLHTPDLMNLLKEIMAETFCMENIMFYDEYVKADLTKDENPDSVKTKLASFKKKYIVTGSINELNISDTLRRKYLKCCDSDNKAAIETLGEIHAHVVQMIYSNSFPYFISKYNNLISNSSRGGSIVSRGGSRAKASLSVKNSDIGSSRRDSQVAQ